MKNLIFLSSTLFIVTRVLASESGIYLTELVGYANISSYWRATPSLSINAGYNFNAYFATEAGLSYTFPVDSLYNNSSTSSNSATVTYTNSNYVYTQNQSFMDVAAVGKIPLSDIFNAYAKLGAGVGYASSSTNMYGINGNYDWDGAKDGFSPSIYMGLGGELYLSQQFHLLVEDYGIMPILGNNWKNVNILGVGIKYIPLASL